MGFWDSLVGHGASDPSWLKGGVKGAIDDFQRYLDMMWSPNAVRGRVGNFTGNYDRSMASTQAAGNASYGARGIRGTPQMALRRSNDVSSFRDQAQQQAYQGMLSGQQQLQGMYLNAQPLFHRAASGGLLGAISPLAQAYGQYMAMGAGNPASAATAATGGGGGGGGGIGLFGNLPTGLPFAPNPAAYSAPPGAGVYGKLPGGLPY